MISNFFLFLLRNSKDYPLKNKLNFETSVSLCLVTYSCPTLWNPMDYSPPDYSVHGDSPGKNTEMGCHFLLQGISPTQELNPNWPSISTGSSSLDSTKPWLTEYADARSPDTQGWLFYAILYKGLTWASVDLGICTVPGTNSPVDIKEQLYTRPLKTWVWIMQVHLYADFILNNYSTMFMFCS